MAGRVGDSSSRWYCCGGVDAVDSAANQKRDLLDFDDFIERPANFEWHIGAYWADKTHEMNDYTKAAYQYATSSYPRICTPGAIITATTESDIPKAMVYACEKNVAMAVRSGGHSFGGTSSTINNNILLDLSKLTKIDQRKSDETIFKVQVGCTLEDFDKKLKENNMFLPHGECGTVCVGGHVQTGGCGAFIRSFGLFQDHITEFTMFLPPEKRGGVEYEDIRKIVVKKPSLSESDTDSENYKLWWAVLGGSPGNFGVILDVTFKALRDEHYPFTRMMTLPLIYSDQVQLQKMLKVISNYNDQEELPANFNFTVLLLKGSRSPGDLKKNYENIDVKMMMDDKGKYGEESSFVSTKTLLVVNCIWIDLNGKDDNTIDRFNTEENGYIAKEIFSEIRKEYFNMFNSVEEYNDVLNDLFNLGRLDLKQDSKLAHFFSNHVHFRIDRPVSVSEINAKTYYTARVQANPYVGFSRLSFRADLARSGFAEYYSKQIDPAETNDPKSGLHPDIQWVFIGGKHCKLKKENCDNVTALPHRNANLLVLDSIHYDNVHNGEECEQFKSEATRISKDRAKKLCYDMNLIPGGYFGGDHRWFAFDYLDKSLDELAYQYYDKHEFWKLYNIKKKFDSQKIMSANRFSIGGPHPGAFNEILPP